MSDVLDVLNKSQEDFENSGFDKWDDYVENIKKEQAYRMLDRLGYFHDSGLYGWLKKKEPGKTIRCDKCGIGVVTDESEGEPDEN